MSSATSRSSRRKPAASATSPRWPPPWRPRSKTSRSPRAAAQDSRSRPRRRARRSWKPPARRSNEADKRVQRLETEARTISKLVNGETKNLWPPIIDGITVAKGYEKAIGAALGDDLDAPVDPSAPMRWTNAGATEGDPALARRRRSARRACRGAGRTGAPPRPDRRRRQESAAPNWCRN